MSFVCVIISNNYCRAEKTRFHQDLIAGHLVQRQANSSLHQLFLALSSHWWVSTAPHRPRWNSYTFVLTIKAKLLLGNRIAKLFQKQNFRPICQNIVPPVTPEIKTSNLQYQSRNRPRCWYASFFTPTWNRLWIISSKCRVILEWRRVMSVGCLLLNG